VRARLASKAARDICKCQGEMASKKEERRANRVGEIMSLDEEEAKRWTRKKVIRTARVPARAEGARTAKSLTPKIAMLTEVV